MAGVLFDSSGELGVRAFGNLGILFGKLLVEARPHVSIRGFPKGEVLGAL